MDTSKNKIKALEKSDNTQKYIRNDSGQKLFSFDIYDILQILFIVFHVWINPYGNAEDEFPTNNVYDFMTCTFKEV